MPQGTANWSQNTIESAVPALRRYGFRRGFVREERVNSYILDTIQSEILRLENAFRLLEIRSGKPKSSRRHRPEAARRFLAILVLHLGHILGKYSTGNSRALAFRRRSYSDFFRNEAGDAQTPKPDF